MKKDNKGFSLVELLIAIAISSIVLMALVMLITQAVRSYTKQTALAQIQSVLIRCQRIFLRQQR